jgi:hypothetical protein
MFDCQSGHHPQLQFNSKENNNNSEEYVTLGKLQISPWVAAITTWLATTCIHRCQYINIYTKGKTITTVTEL